MGFEPCNETYVPNTTMEVFVNSSGIRTQYAFTPNNGYVLHDNTCDIPPNAVGNPETIEYFTTGKISVSINYDFDNITTGTYEGVDGVTYNVTKIGACELYTLPASIIPQNKI